MTKSIAEALAAYASDEDLKAAKRRLGAAMPDRGWLADYLRAVTPHTDAPPEFHLISGMCALSGAAGNRFYTESWAQNVFPHLWAVIVAPSSFWRKSTAIGQAERMLTAAGDDGPDGTSLVYPPDFTREKLVGILKDRPTGFMAQKEFGGFLSLLGRDYNAGLKEMLTDLYDGPDLYTRAMQKEVIEVRRPAITILGATTLDWLESKITDGDLRGGFLARFLFVTATSKAAAKGMTRLSDDERKDRARLAIFLRDVRQMEPAESTFEPDAWELLNDWTLGWEGEVGQGSHASDLSGFAVRLQTYALKFAILYRLSAQYSGRGEPAPKGDPRLVDVASVRAAIAYCRVLWSNVSALIDDRLAITKDAKELRRLLGIIGAGVTRSAALKASKLRARDFDQFLQTLVDSGQVFVTTVRASEVGLDRARDSQLKWLSTTPSASTNGHYSGSPARPGFDDLSGPGTPKGTGGEPEEGGNEGEPEGPDLSSDGPSSSTSLLLSQTHDSLLGIYAGGGNGKRWLGRYSRSNAPHRVQMLVELADGTSDEATINRIFLADGHAAALTHVLDLLAARPDQDDPESFL